jgi:hypothetical protein
MHFAIAPVASTEDQVDLKVHLCMEKKCLGAQPHSGLRQNSSTSGDIGTSAEAGTTWAKKTNLQKKSIGAIPADETMTKLAAAVEGNSLYLSADSVETWTESKSASKKSWNGVASSNDGAVLVAAVNNGFMCLSSTESGATWAQPGTA